MDTKIVRNVFYEVKPGMGVGWQVAGDRISPPPIK